MKRILVLVGLSVLILTVSVVAEAGDAPQSVSGRSTASSRYSAARVTNNLISIKACTHRKYPTAQLLLRCINSNIRTIVRQINANYLCTRVTKLTFDPWNGATTQDGYDYTLGGTSGYENEAVRAAYPDDVSSNQYFYAMIWSKLAACQ